MLLHRYWMLLPVLCTGIAIVIGIIIKTYSQIGPNTLDLVVMERMERMEAVLDQHNRGGSGPSVLNVDLMDRIERMEAVLHQNSMRDVKQRTLDIETAKRMDRMEAVLDKHNRDGVRLSTLAIETMERIEKMEAVLDQKSMGGDRQRALDIETAERMYKMETVLDDLQQSLASVADMMVMMIEQNIKTKGDDKVNILMHLAEEESEARKGEDEDVVNTVGNFLSEILSYTNTNLSQIAEQSHQHGKHLQALILYKCSYHLFRKQNNSDDLIAQTIVNVTRQIFESCQPLIKAGEQSRVVATNSGVRYVESLWMILSALRSIPTKKIACYVEEYVPYIVILENGIGEHDQVLQNVKKLKLSVGNEKASCFQFRGSIRHSQGYAYESLTEYDKAKQSYTKAMDAFNNPDQDQHTKSDNIAMVKASMNRLEKRWWQKISPFG